MSAAGLAVGDRVLVGEPLRGSEGTRLAYGIVRALESDRVEVETERHMEWYPRALVVPAASLPRGRAASVRPPPSLAEILAAYETMSGADVLALREGLPRVALEWTTQVGTGDRCRPWSVEDRPRLMNGRVDPRPTSDNNIAARVITLTGDDAPADGMVFEALVDHKAWEPTRHATESEAMIACDEGLRALRVALCRAAARGEVSS